MAASHGKWKLARHLSLLNRRLLDVAAGRSRRLVISMPPRHGKSMLTSHYFPAWYLGLFPERQVILTSYEADFASSWGRKARQTLEEFGPQIFGVRVADESSAAHRWGIAKHGGGMQTAGAGGPITGKGADLFIIDDPIKGRDDADSAALRQKVWEWYQSVAYTRLEPAGSIVVIMTRWHRDDLAGRLLRSSEDGGEMWERIELAARSGEHDPLGRALGEPLWPERYGLAELARIERAVGPRAWSALYQQNPLADSGSEWPLSYFPDAIWFQHWPDLRLRILALDPSKGGGDRTGDYSAYVRLGICARGHLWVDADLARRPIPRMVEEGVAHLAAFRPQAFALEVNQFQELLIGEFQRAATAAGAMMLPIVPLENRLRKETRIRTLGPLLSQGVIHFLAHSRGAELLVEQLRDFPHADHDDGPDALEMAVRVAGQLCGSGEPRELLSGWQQLYVD